MNSTYVRRHKGPLVAVVACGVLTAIAVLLMSGATRSGATSSSTPNQSISILKPDTAEAKQALPEKARLWLEGVEHSSLPGLKDEELIGLGTTSAQEGEVVVAQLGQSVCAYSVQYGMNTCGGLNLINEGKLFVVVPRCPTGVILGLLPDGFSKIHVKTTSNETSSSEKDIPVSSNVYVDNIVPGEMVVSGGSNSGQSFRVELPFGQTSCE